MAVKTLRPDARVFGVEPELAADAAESLREGRIVRWDADQVGRTAADGMRTSALGTLTFQHLSRYADGVLTVSEIDIRRAMVVAARVGPTGGRAIGRDAHWRRGCRTRRNCRPVPWWPSSAAAMSTATATPSSSPKASRLGDDVGQVHPYHPPVINDRTQTVPSLFDAVRALARGDDLDATLAALCDQACAASGALAGIDPAVRDRHRAADACQRRPRGHRPRRRSRPRRSSAIATRPGTWPCHQGCTGAVAGAERGAIVPLVREDQAGATVEGVMILGGGSALGADAPNVETVLAIADLAAVAIRQERLRSTSAEGLAYQERLARTDPLTGLADRHTFGQMLELELARATRLGTSLAVAIFDVDDLAGINEQHGAGVGDDVLRSVAATLADQVRLVDTVARIGPDEFGVIAPGDPGGMVARRVRDAVADLPAIGGVRASIRAGVAHHPQDGTSSGDLLDAAHVAIARARVEGAGTVVGLRGMPDLEAGPVA